MSANLIVLGAAGGLALVAASVLVFRQLGAVPVSVRLGAGPTAVVALASGVMSWDALSWGAGELGVDKHLSWLYPVSIDGMILVGTVAALALRRAKGRVRAYVWALLVGGIVASVVGNAAHAAAGSWLHVVGAAVPAVALAASLHLLVLLVRHVPPPADDAGERSSAGAGATAAPRLAPTERRRRVTAAPLLAAANPATDADATTAAAVDGATEGVVLALGVAPARRRVSGLGGRREDPRLARMARLLERAREGGEPEPTNGELARALRTSETTARRLRSRLEQAAAPAAAAEEA